MGGRSKPKTLGPAQTSAIRRARSLCGEVSPRHDADAVRPLTLGRRTGGRSEPKMPETQPCKYLRRATDPTITFA
jgi:hypothetical protein